MRQRPFAQLGLQPGPLLRAQPLPRHRPLRPQRLSAAVPPGLMPPPHRPLGDPQVMRDLADRVAPGEPFSCLQPQPLSPLLLGRRVPAPLRIPHAPVIRPQPADATGSCKPPGWTPATGCSPACTPGCSTGPATWPPCAGRTTGSRCTGCRSSTTSSPACRCRCSCSTRPTCTSKGSTRAEREIAGKTTEIARLARKTGMALELATHIPSLAEMGGEQALGDMLRGGNVVSLRTANRVSGGMLGLEKDPSEIPMFFPDGKETYGLGYCAGPITGRTRRCAPTWSPRRCAARCPPSRRWMTGSWRRWTGRCAASRSRPPRPGPGPGRRLR